MLGLTPVVLLQQVHDYHIVIAVVLLMQDIVLKSAGGKSCFTTFRAYVLPTSHVICLLLATLTTCRTAMRNTYRQAGCHVVDLAHQIVLCMARPALYGDY